jgi:hypothetical protein
MGQTCKICRHAQRELVEQAMIERESIRSIAARFGFSAAAVQRHRRGHLPVELREAHHATQTSRLRTLLGGLEAGEDRAEKLYRIAEAILEKSLAARDLTTALRSIKTGVDVLREAREYLRLRGAATGELDPGGGADSATPSKAVVILPRLEDLRHREGYQKLLDSMGDDYR